MHGTRGGSASAWLGGRRGRGPCPVDSLVMLQLREALHGQTRALF